MFRNLHSVLLVETAMVFSHQSYTRFNLLSVVSALLFSFTIVSIQAHAIEKLSMGSATSLFVENKGQITDQFGRPNHDVRFLIERLGLNIQLRSNGFSYDSYVTTSSINVHRIDVDLLGANPNPLITASGASSDYQNYYTRATQQVHGDRGATEVRGYATVTYHNVWPGVDMEWFLDANGQPEYQFIVRPGGDVASIQLKYRGANSTELLADAVVLQVEHGPIRETLPRSYVLERGGNIDVRYRALGNDVYGFTMPLADVAMGETLVIDPMPRIAWATYIGGDGRDGASSVATLTDGSVIVAGQTRSANRIATAGSFRTTIEPENWDGFVVAFDNKGQKMWGTYFGGDAWDVAMAVAVSDNGDIFLTGWSDSQTGIATAGSHKPMNDGTRDGFLCRFTSTGQRLWGSFVGGEGWDVSNDVAITPEGNVVVVGWTKSLQGIASESSFQQQYGGSECDAFLAVYSPDGIRQWGTYYGGAGWDVANAVAVSPLGDIIVVGWTDSKSVVVATDGHQQSPGGQQDGFVARFLGDGRLRWGSFYGGSNEDQITDVTVTKSGHIVVVGQTKSTTDIATEGAHLQQLIGEGNSAFIASFERSGGRLWGTYYGGEGEDLALSVAMTPSDDIAVVGCTQSWTDISTDSSLQSAYGGGNWDGFAAIFGQAGQRTWGSYFGGDGADIIRSVDVASNGSVLLAGESGSASNVATENSHQSQLVGENDAFLAIVQISPSTNVNNESGNKTHAKIASLRPNPATGYTVVTTSATTDAVLIVVDVLGRVLVSQPIAAGETTTTISTSGLPSGSYYLRLEPVAGTGNVQAHTQALIVVP